MTKRKSVAGLAVRREMFANPEINRYENQCTEMGHFLSIRVTRSAGVAGCEAASCVTLTV